MFGMRLHPVPLEALQPGHSPPRKHRAVLVPSGSGSGEHSLAGEDGICARQEAKGLF
jgi:hypothetical protein